MNQNTEYLLNSTVMQHTDKKKIWEVIGEGTFMFSIYGCTEANMQGKKVRKRKCI